MSSISDNDIPIVGYILTDNSCRICLRDEASVFMKTKFEAKNPGREKTITISVTDALKTVFPLEQLQESVSIIHFIVKPNFI